MCKTVVRSALPFFFFFWHGIPAIVIDGVLNKSKTYFFMDFATLKD